MNLLKYWLWRHLPLPVKKLLFPIGICIMFGGPAVFGCLGFWYLTGNAIIAVFLGIVCEIVAIILYSIYL